MRLRILLVLLTRRRCRCEPAESRWSRKEPDENKRRPSPFDDDALSAAALWPATASRTGDAELMLMAFGSLTTKFGPLLAVAAAGGGVMTMFRGVGFEECSTPDVIVSRSVDTVARVGAVVPKESGIAPRDAVASPATSGVLVSAVASSFIAL